MSPFLSVSTGWAQPTALEARLSTERLALERSPQDHEARFALTKTLLSLKRYQEALTTISPLTKLSQPARPVELKALYLKAYLTRQLQRYAEAVTAYQSLIEETSDPQQALEAEFGLAKSLELMGDPVGASEAYARFAEKEKRPEKARWVKAARAAIKRLSAQVAPIERGGEVSALEAEEQRLQLKPGVSKAPAQPTQPAQPAPAPVLEPAQPAQPTQTPSSAVVKATQPAQPAQPAPAPVLEPAQPAQPAQPAPASVLEPAQPPTSEPAASEPAAMSKLTLAVADKLFSEAQYKNAAFAYRAIAQRSLPSEEVRARLLHRAAVSAFLAKEHRDALIDAERALSLPIQSEGLRRTLKGIAVMSLLQEDAPPPEPSSARLALAEGRFEDALTLARVLLSAGEDPNMRRVEGKALLALGDAKGALKALKRAAQAGPHLHLLLEVAQAAEESGERREATQAYQGVLRALAQPVARGEAPLPSDQSALGRLALEGIKRLQGGVTPQSRSSRARSSARGR